MCAYIPLCLLVPHELLIGDVECLRLPIVQALLSHDHLDGAAGLLDEVPRLEVCQREVTREVRCGLARAEGVRDGQTCLDFPAGCDVLHLTDLVVVAGRL